jgi:ribose transport system permease protein
MKLVGRLLRNGTLRAAIILIIFVIIWASLQMGGLNLFLINGWLQLSLPLVIAAVGVTLVIFLGEFDMSAAGVMVLINVSMVTWLTDFGWWGVLIALVMGALIGLFNGLMIVFLKLPAIAVTLSLLIVFEGLALVILPAPGGKVSPSITEFVTGEFIIPRSIIFLVIISLLWFIYSRTRLGVHTFGVGQDAEALKLSGVNVSRVKVVVFIIAGTLYALAGVVLSASLQGGDAKIASSYLLATFAAIAIGGTAFTGGSGSAFATVLGALTLMVLPKVLFVLGFSGWVQNIITGLLIIAAVLVGAISVVTENRRKQTVKRKSASGGEGGQLAPASAEGGEA